MLAGFFRYLGVLRAHNDWLTLWRESKQLAQTMFDFKDKEDPYSYVSSLANLMHDYAGDDILQGPFVPGADATQQVNDLINEVIHAVNTTQMNVFEAASGKNLRHLFVERILFVHNYYFFLLQKNKL